MTKAAVVSLAAYGVAAIAEIAGCFSFWAWLRLGRSVLWLVPGMLSLALFAFMLTFVESDAAGRAYAAYGGIYITASLLWLVAGGGDLPRSVGWRRSPRVSDRHRYHPFWPARMS